MVLLPEREQAQSSEINPHTLTQLGIDLLIDLAQRGEIDPWDVQVIDVIDNHLSKIPQQAAAAGAGNKQANLSLSGQAFLWAAMLVLLKADSLADQPPAEAVEELLEDPEQLALIEAGGLPPNLEKLIRRRLTAGSPP